MPILIVQIIITHPLICETGICSEIDLNNENRLKVDFVFVYFSFGSQNATTFASFFLIILLTSLSLVDNLE